MPPAPLASILKMPTKNRHYDDADAKKLLSMMNELFSPLYVLSPRAFRMPGRRVTNIRPMPVI